MDERERIVAEMHRRAAEIPTEYYALEKPANRFLYRRYVRAARQLLRQAGAGRAKVLRVLEVGCGDAKWLVEMLSWGARAENLHGIDLDEQHIERARMRLPDVDLRVGDAAHMPWADGEFDLIIQSTMFTSILSPDMHTAVAREMMRVLRPGGVILWYDFIYDNPRNKHVKGIPVRRVRELFPGFEMTYRKVTLAPPIARAVVPVSDLLAGILNRLPFLRTHVVATLCKPDA